MITAERLAIIAHGDQHYGILEYRYHLELVVDALSSFGFTDKKWVDAGWLHDTLEDTKVTTADIINLCGVEVADMVVAVSGFGKNRKEKQADILNKLQYNEDACILKLADRLVNVHFSLSKTGDHSKFEMYKAEQEAFAKVVQPNVPTNMWGELEKLIK